MVNATSGVVMVRNGSLLDRELRSVYYANLQAKDGDNMTGTTLLEITVLDENDEKPVIIGSYFISVEEGQNVSTQIRVGTMSRGVRVCPGLQTTPLHPPGARFAGHRQ